MSLPTQRDRGETGECDLLFLINLLKVKKIYIYIFSKAFPT